ncbi:MAG: glycogen/starch/alpha-glucan phosphorylase, partial [Mariprofundaceae bacterium]
MTTPRYSILDAPLLSRTPEGLVGGIQRHYLRTLGQHTTSTADHYRYQALAFTIRDHLMEAWKFTKDACEEGEVRRAYYLSLEYLMGRALGNAILNLGLDEETRQAMHLLGLSLEEKIEMEHDAGLGNGGLGRLAACFLDSCATLKLPVVGYGLRYEYGMFRQKIENGWQVEEPDNWLRNGHVWEIERPEYIQRIHFGGRSESYHDDEGRLRYRWVDTHDV